MITDLMQAVSYLRARSDVDPWRLAAAGYSMGSVVLAFGGALELRLRACALVGGGNLDGPGGYWDRAKPMCTGIPYRSLSFLGDRVDALAAPHYASNGVLPHMHQIRDEIARNAGGRFAPELVAAFLQASARAAFWLRLEPRSIQAALQDRLALAGEGNAPTGSLRELARIFSRIVDAKSPFTAEHSLGVAGVACLLARRLGVAPDNVDKLEIAALLHDLGKLRVPDEILDKPGKLDPAERLVINSHSFETFQILRNIKGFEEIAPWAAYHHEEPGGSGYPFHVDAATLPIEARILRVADIFQAMVQDRPYRAGLGAQEALAFLQKLAGEGRIDRTVFATLSAFTDEAMRAARPGASRDVQSEGADHV